MLVLFAVSFTLLFIFNEFSCCARALARAPFDISAITSVWQIASMSAVRCVYLQKVTTTERKEIDKSCVCLWTRAAKIQQNKHRTTHRFRRENRERKWIGIQHVVDLLMLILILILNMNAFVVHSLQQPHKGDEEVKKWLSMKWHIIYRNEIITYPYIALTYPYTNNKYSNVCHSFAWM